MLCDAISDTITFQLDVTASGLPLQIPIVVPAITLGGREAKLIVTDYSFGSKSKVSYSTAEIFYAGVLDGRDVLFLHGNSTQAHEAALALTGTNKAAVIPPASPLQLIHGNAKAPSGTTIISITPGFGGLTTVWDSDTQLILFADTDTATTFWQPVLAGKDSDPLKNYWSIGTNTSILMGGPYLVRGATLTGSTLALRGDLKEDVKLTVVAPRSVRSITWNGQHVSIDAAASSSVTQFGGFVGQLRANPALQSIRIPKLSNWKFKDSLPEIQSSFDDSSWTIADHTTTNIPLKPYYGDGRILYGCDYGL